MRKIPCMIAAFLFVLIPLLCFADISVLSSKTHEEFASENQWTGGAKAYSKLVNKLAGILARSGERVVKVSDADIASGTLEGSTSLFIIDTLATRALTLEKVKDFVRRGGLVVVVGDFARNVDGAWQSVWPCADLMGLDPVSCDQWGSATSMSGKLFTKAQLLTPHEVLTGVQNPLLFGPATFMCWVCKPDSAQVLAQFPSYLSTANDAKTVINEPCSAVSVNAFGTGHAVFIAALPGGKQALALNSGDIQTVLLNVLKLAPEKLATPARAEQTLSIDIDQIGFKPGDEKVFTLRVENVRDEQKLPAAFDVVTANGDVVAGRLPLKRFPDFKWKGMYLTGDFSEIKTPGKYKIKAGSAESPVFEIREDIYMSKAIPVQLSFLRKMAAGLDYYMQDDPRGGFIDASGDYSVRMWSMPYVVYCLAGLYENLPEGSIKDEVFSLFNHGAQWLLKAHTKEGNLLYGVGPGDDVFKADRRPWQDKTKRIALTNQVPHEIIMAYCAAMAKAAMVFRQKNNQDMAGKCFSVSKQVLDKALPGLDDDTQTIGNAIWASTLMYEASGDEGFYKQALPMAKELMNRQIKEPADSVFPTGVAGMFSNSANAQELIQYKVFHSVGIYLGLIQLYKQCTQKQDTALAEKLKNSLLLWQNQFLLKMSSFSPYGQLAHGLEPFGDSFEISFFPPKTSGTERHGLNCDHASQAYIALKLNAVFPDQKLRAFAAKQLYWINGHNPLGFCMIESLGTSNPPSMPEGWGTGILEGAMPNGISGAEDDSPCWINGWQSMEYWLPQTVFYLLCCSSL